MGLRLLILLEFEHFGNESDSRKIYNSRHMQRIKIVQDCISKIITRNIPSGSEEVNRKFIRTWTFVLCHAVKS